MKPLKDWTFGELQDICKNYTCSVCPVRFCCKYNFGDSSFIPAEWDLTQSPMIPGLYCDSDVSCDVYEKEAAQFEELTIGGQIRKLGLPGIYTLNDFIEVIERCLGE